MDFQDINFTQDIPEMSNIPDIGDFDFPDFLKTEDISASLPISSMPSPDSDLDKYISPDSLFDSISPAAVSGKSGSNTSGSAKQGGKVKKDRSSHNKIEKKYRTNINAKIIALRDAVPALRIAADASASMTIADLDGLLPASKLNKASVLTKATEYIKHLEQKNDVLTQQNAELRQILDNVNNSNRMNGANRSVGGNGSVDSVMFTPPIQPPIHNSAPVPGPAPGQMYEYNQYSNSNEYTANNFNFNENMNYAAPPPPHPHHQQAPPPPPPQAYQQHPQDLNMGNGFNNFANKIMIGGMTTLVGSSLFSDDDFKGLSFLPIPFMKFFNVIKLFFLLSLVFVLFFDNKKDSKDPKNSVESSTRSLKYEPSLVSLAKNLVNLINSQDQTFKRFFQSVLVKSILVHKIPFLGYVFINLQNDVKVLKTLPIDSEISYLKNYLDFEFTEFEISHLLNEDQSSKLGAKLKGRSIFERFAIIKSFKVINKLNNSYMASLLLNDEATFKYPSLYIPDNQLQNNWLLNKAIFDSNISNFSERLDLKELSGLEPNIKLILLSTYLFKNEISKDSSFNEAIDQLSFEDLNILSFISCFKLLYKDNLDSDLRLRLIRSLRIWLDQNKSMNYNLKVEFCDKVVELAKKLNGIEV